jgi:hypothetical protein
MKLENAALKAADRLAMDPTPQQRSTSASARHDPIRPRSWVSLPSSRSRHRRERHHVPLATTQAVLVVMR